MAVVPAETFERWLRRLDAERLRGFVSDLYAESGREVRRRADGALVVGAEGRVVVTFHARRRLRAPRVPDDADAVVAASPSRRLVRRAATAGATLVGPADLRNLALYGVDREDCERLFRRYFDESPSVERADAAGGEAGAAGDAPASDGGASGVRGRIAAEPLSSLVVLALAGLVVAALVGPFGPGVPSEADDAAGSTGPVVVGAPTEAVEDEDGLFPPGVGPTGVVSADTLAAAHADAAAGRSYRLTVRQSGTATWTGGTWDIVYQRADVAGPTRYRYSVTGYRATDDGGAELVRYSAFADGRNNYVSTDDGENRSYVRYDASTDRHGHGPFENRAARAVERYLDTTRTSVTRENWSVSPYRVVATGTPSSVPEAGNVTDYRAEAHVGADGFVSRLTVSYDVRTAEGTRSVSFEMHYVTKDSETVRSPSWYDDARNATADAPRGAVTTPAAPKRTAASGTDERSNRTAAPTGTAAPARTARANESTPANETETTTRASVSTGVPLAGVRF